MTGPKDTDVARLVYAGSSIRERGEMLSLTDMWKAAGADDAKRPANWARKEGRDFIDHVAEIHNVPQGHIIIGARGKGGSTFAHWQIGLAYAKYLSPEFHMWCNSVVRAHMEARRIGVAAHGDVAEQLAEIRQTLDALKAAGVAPTMNYADTVTSSGIIELAGIRRADRVRGTAVMVTHAMLDFCGGVGCVRTAADLNPARPWRFPADRAREWLFGRPMGAEQIRNQIARQGRAKMGSGQAALRLVPPSAGEDRPSA